MSESMRSFPVLITIPVDPYTVRVNPSGTDEATGCFWFALLTMSENRPIYPTSSSFSPLTVAQTGDVVMFTSLYPLAILPSAELTMSPSVTRWPLRTTVSLYVLTEDISNSLEMYSGAVPVERNAFPVSLGSGDTMVMLPAVKLPEVPLYIWSTVMSPTVTSLDSVAERMRYALPPSSVYDISLSRVSTI